MPGTLELDRPRDGVVVLRLNRPERLNAINEAMRNELAGRLSDLAGDDSVRAVVLTGAGRGFCSGIDVRDFGPGMLEASAPALDRMRFQARMAALGEAVRALPAPVIAAVNGPCVGAGWPCAWQRTSEYVRLSHHSAMPLSCLGSGAEMGMSYHLPRIVGTSVAADWMLTGRTVSAAEADRRGLVSEVVEPDRLCDRALELASHLADLAPLGVQLTKRALQVNTDAGDPRGAGAGEPQPGDHPRHPRGGRASTKAALGPNPVSNPLAGVDGALPLDYTVRRNHWACSDQRRG